MPCCCLFELTSLAQCLMEVYDISYHKYHTNCHLLSCWDEWGRLVASLYRLMPPLRRWTSWSARSPHTCRCAAATQLSWLFGQNRGYQATLISSKVYSINCCCVGASYLRRCNYIRSNLPCRMCRFYMHRVNVIIETYPLRNRPRRPQKRILRKILGWKACWSCCDCLYYGR